jgi:hypothetical protein
MSGPLLIGIAAVGVGWAWLHREGDKTPAAIGKTIVADGTPVSADEANHATVATEVPQATQGVAAVASAVAASSYATTIGHVPVEGSDGGQVIPVSYEGPDGTTALVIDRTKSTGGADPATQMTALHNGESPPIIAQGDTHATILATLFGPCGGDGLTEMQKSNAIRDSAVWSNEVF